MFFGLRCQASFYISMLLLRLSFDRKAPFKIVILKFDFNFNVKVPLRFDFKFLFEWPFLFVRVTLVIIFWLLNELIMLLEPGNLGVDFWRARLDSITFALPHCECANTSQCSTRAFARSVVWSTQKTPMYASTAAKGNLSVDFWPARFNNFRAAPLRVRKYQPMQHQSVWERRCVVNAEDANVHFYKSQRQSERRLLANQDRFNNFRAAPLRVRKYQPLQHQSVWERRCVANAEDANVHSLQQPQAIWTSTFGEPGSIQ